MDPKRREATGKAAMGDLIWREISEAWQGWQSAHQHLISLCMSGQTKRADSGASLHRGNPGPEARGISWDLVAHPVTQVIGEQALVDFLDLSEVAWTWWDVST